MNFEAEIRKLKIHMSGVRNWSDEVDLSIKATFNLCQQLVDLVTELSDRVAALEHPLAVTATTTNQATVEPAGVPTVSGDHYCDWRRIAERDLSTLVPMPPPEVNDTDIGRAWQEGYLFACRIMEARIKEARP